MGFDEINWALIAPVLVLQLILMVVAFIDLSKVKQTRGPKIFWIIFVLVSGIIGSICYFIFGKKQ